MALCKLWTAEVASEAPLLWLAINQGLYVFKQNHFKPFIRRQYKHFSKGQDVFVTDPEGCGKSLIYQVLPARAALSSRSSGKQLRRF